MRSPLPRASALLVVLAVGGCAPEIDFQLADAIFPGPDRPTLAGLALGQGIDGLSDSMKQLDPEAYVVDQPNLRSVNHRWDTLDRLQISAVHKDGKIRSIDAEVCGQRGDNIKQVGDWYYAKLDELKASPHYERTWAPGAHEGFVFKKGTPEEAHVELWVHPGAAWACARAEIKAPDER